MLFTNLEFNQQQQNRMRALVAPDEVHFGNPEQIREADREAFLKAEIAFGWCPPEWLAEAEGLRWMQFDSVGIGEYAHLDWDRLSTRVTCTNLRGFFAEPVAETVLAGILALYRGIDRLVELQPRRAWMKLTLRPQLKMLANTTVVLVGHGALGQRLKVLLAPFGCRVIAYDRFAEGADLTQLAELDAVLPGADIVCAALPDTPDTRGLFDEARFGLLKAGALFVNVGRGSLVVENVLVAHLLSGRLGGAVLDVTQQEPLPGEHPLWQCPSTILTQHTAGGSSDELDRKITFFAENLRCYRQGMPLDNVINWTRGF
jgi:glyoxylate/hydroxypyruvate reductase